MKKSRLKGKKEVIFQKLDEWYGKFLYTFRRDLTEEEVEIIFLETVNEMKAFIDKCIQDNYTDSDKEEYMNRIKRYNMFFDELKYNEYIQLYLFIIQSFTFTQSPRLEDDENIGIFNIITIKKDIEGYIDEFNNINSANIEELEEAQAKCRFSIEYSIKKLIKSMLALYENFDRLETLSECTIYTKHIGIDKDKYSKALNTLVVK